MTHRIWRGLNKTILTAVKDTPDFGRGKAVDMLGEGADMVEDRVREKQAQKLAHHLGIELVKMSTPQEKTPEEKTLVRGLATGGGAMGAQAVLGGAVGASMQGKGNSELASRMLDSAKRQGHVDIKKDMFNPQSASYGDRSFDPSYKGPTVNFGSDAMKHPGIVAHELGHAEVGRSRLGRVLQNRKTLALGMASPLIGGLSGSLSGLSDNEHVQRLGIAAPLLTSAPQLLYEGGASLLGMRNIRRHGGGWGDVARAGAQLLPAFGTYAAQAGMGVGTALASQGMVRGIRNANKIQEPQEKQAFTTSEYSGPMGGARFQQVSLLPSIPVPGLEKAVEKPQPKFAAALTPAGRLVSSQQTGKGFGQQFKGPSIAAVSKPPRMGTAIPGATEKS